MTLVVLVAAGVVSWSLRIALITLVPATRLPERVQAALRHVAPAALSALVVTGLARQAGPAAHSHSWAPLGAAAAAALVAWRTRSLAATVVAALACLWVIRLLGA